MFGRGYDQISEFSVLLSGLRGLTPARHTSTVLVPGKLDTAKFVPTNAMAITTSTSSAVAFVVTAAPVPVAVTTTTAQAVSPATAGAPASATLTATVTGAAAAGMVEFFNGTTSLGTSTVAAGIATKTLVGVVAGSYSYTAKFIPDGRRGFHREHLVGCESRGHACWHTVDGKDHLVVAHPWDHWIQGGHPGHRLRRSWVSEVRRRHCTGPSLDQHEHRCDGAVDQLGPAFGSAGRGNGDPQGGYGIPCRELPRGPLERP
jgi:hypothetical protein